MSLPLAHHADENSKKCNQEPPILPRQRDCCALYLSVSPVGPEP